LEYAIRKVQDNQVRLELIGTHQFLAYADGVDLLGNNIETIERNTEISIDASKEVSLEVNVKYLGTTVTNQNLIQGGIKRRLNSDNACYHSVQNLLSSHLLSKNLNIRIYKTIILPVALYGCELGL
jgi:hypothetical protein